MLPGAIGNGGQRHHRFRLVLTAAPVEALPLPVLPIELVARCAPHRRRWSRPSMAAVLAPVTVPAIGIGCLGAA